MKVILYSPDYGNKRSCSYLVTMALSEGLTKLGVEHDVRRCRDWKGEIADIAIVNGWLKKFIENAPAGNRTQVINAQAEADKPAWCIERGFLGDRELWSAMSIGGFCSNGGDFRAEGMPSDRWDALDITLQPWREPGEKGYILLAAQVPWDAQVDEGNHGEWLTQTAGAIMAATKRRVRLRPHPKAFRREDPYRGVVTGGVDWSRCPVPTSTFEEDLTDAHAVVCYNSNVAILATVAGVPVFTGAPCLADPIACRDLALLDDPPRPDRRQWANDLAYRQWHLEEFREALPWLHLMR